MACALYHKIESLDIYGYNSTAGNTQVEDLLVDGAVERALCVRYLHIAQSCVVDLNLGDACTLWIVLLLHAENTVAVNLSLEFGSYTALGVIDNAYIFG